MVCPTIQSDIGLQRNILNHQPDKIRNLIAIAQSSKRREVSEVLGRITHPTCLIWGRDDLITPPATAEAFRRAIPRATLWWVEQCGHAPMVEQPETFNRLLTQWLAAPLEGLSAAPL